jgi:adenylate cyclase
MPDGAGAAALTGAELARVVERRATISAIAATIAVGIIASVLYIAVAPFTFGQAGSRAIARLLPLAWAYGIACFAIEALRAHRRFAVVRSWLAAGRPPTPDEWRRMLAIPRAVAVWAAVYWAILGALAVPYFLSELSATREQYARTTASIAIAMFMSSLLVFLLVERAMRPVIARAQRADPTLVRGGIGLSMRLALALVAVAGIPVVAIINTLTGTSRQVEETASTAVVVAVGGSIFAVLTMVFVGRAITEPLRRLRDAQALVQTGRFDASVDVDESGEIGLVQAGFNAMVAGLRERERMREVFGRHVGADVARLAMERDFGSGGHTCEATAMFVDVIGSTGLAQRNDPDAVVEILNRFFDAVVRCVAAEGGFVNKFHGDGALCIFGAPVPQDDHAARALRVARALARELAPMGDLAAAIGVSSGPVVAGNVGAIDRYEFTVIGDPVNEASRLSDEAKLHPSHVLVSDRTIAAAADAARGWIGGEAIALRGRSQPTITYSPYD